MGCPSSAKVVFDLAGDQALIDSISVASAAEGPFHPLAESVDPVLLVRVGPRDLEKRSGWTVFFDRMQDKPSELFEVHLEPSYAKAASHQQRATVTVGGAAAGPFRGEIQRNTD